MSRGRKKKFDFTIRKTSYPKLTDVDVKMILIALKRMERELEKRIRYSKKANYLSTTRHTVPYREKKIRLIHEIRKELERVYGFSEVYKRKVSDDDGGTFKDFPESI